MVYNFLINKKLYKLYFLSYNIYLEKLKYNLKNIYLLIIKLMFLYILNKKK